MALEFPVDRAALLLVELQNDMVHESNIGQKGLGGTLAPRVHERQVLQKTARVLEAARPRGVPVLYVNMCAKPGFPRPPAPIYRRLARGKQALVEGTWGAEVHQLVAPRPEDFVLCRTVSFDGSYGTQLYPVVRMLGRTTLVVLGISTNFAVEGIVRASVNRGFEVVVVEDCCASISAEMHDWSIRNIMPVLATVTSSDELLAHLANSPLKKSGPSQRGERRA
ncbi:MAG: cysteine hydrolase family protein, partial [Candidatus Binatia bacterium]